MWLLTEQLDFLDNKETNNLRIAFEYEYGVFRAKLYNY